MDFTLECSGNHGGPIVNGLIGNARWAGTPLAPVLEEAHLRKDAIEVVFYGIDGGMQTIRDNTGIFSAGQTGTIPPEGGGLTIPEPFARSMSLDDALDPRNLLCYEMNGEPLPHKNGFPVRLIAPGWYGVANVKWLTRIEVRDQRHAGNFMARDYVTIREEHRGSSDPFWTFSTVRHFRLKSAPAKVVRRGGRHVVLGAAWGAPIAAVQVRIDNGPWRSARLFGPVARTRRSRGLAWQFWTFNWGMPAAGEHRVTSRAFDDDGNMQPAPNDPFLASKVTFWRATATSRAGCSFPDRGENRERPPGDHLSGGITGSDEQSPCPECLQNAGRTERNRGNASGRGCGAKTLQMKRLSPEVTRHHQLGKIG